MAVPGDWSGSWLRAGRAPRDSSCSRSAAPGPSGTAAAAALAQSRARPPWPSQLPPLNLRRALRLSAGAPANPAGSGSQFLSQPAPAPAPPALQLLFPTPILGRPQRGTDPRPYLQHRRSRLSQPFWRPRLSVEARAPRELGAQPAKSSSASALTAVSSPPAGRHRATANVSCCCPPPRSAARASAQPVAAEDPGIEPVLVLGKRFRPKSPTWATWGSPGNSAPDPEAGQPARPLVPGH